MYLSWKYRGSLDGTRIGDCKVLSYFWYGYSYEVAAKDARAQVCRQNMLPENDYDRSSVLSNLIS